MRETKREEHIAAAGRFARENPEWTADFPYVRHQDGGFAVWSIYDGLWRARDRRGLALNDDLTGNRMRFPTPASAVAALGPSPAPESTDVR